ncbi:unnamed protein product [Schistosoma margrebowiei]|uniref:Uncharacterized protein n=1 Tax=Schistosoma margrebowiei TaxID=48269 RepID=A0A183MRU6_9TREM|nr:unnamed protein product [Schistosoma margrebowiei]
MRVRTESLENSVEQELVDAVITCALVQHVKEATRIVDRNGDGHLDPDEIALRMSKIFNKITKEEVRLLLDTVKMDEDQTLDCEEFGALLRSGFSEARK